MERAGLGGPVARSAGAAGYEASSAEGRFTPAVLRVSSRAAGADALSHLSAGTTDNSPRTRLEAVRALAQWKSAETAEAALGVLDKPTDRVLDYALWLTLRELEPKAESREP